MRKDLGFVPYGDMLNHQAPEKVNCRWKWDDAQHGYTVEALLDIRRGEEIYDSYGDKCNCNLL